MIIRYDHTLTGFCCLLGTVIKDNLDWSQVKTTADHYCADLFHEECLITTDPGWANRVSEGLRSRLGEEFIRKLGLAFLSETDGIEEVLIRVTRQALKQGPGFLKKINHPLVHQFEKAALHTSRDRHRLLGLIRFNRLRDDSYLACIEPRTHITPLLGGHFAKRLEDQRWIIADTRRNCGVLGGQGRWHFDRSLKIHRRPEWHDTETEVVELWRSFYTHISNPQRHNPKLRQHFMPKQYWRYLTEMHPAETCKYPHPRSRPARQIPE